MTALEQIEAELMTLGYSPTALSIGGLGGEQAAVIDYPVPTGRFGKQTFQVGIAFQEEGYPEYPPHFVWVANLPEPRLPAHSTAKHDGTNWVSFSVPPNDFWDRLPAAEKTMKSYLKRHLLRFWTQV